MVLLAALFLVADVNAIVARNVFCSRCSPARATSSRTPDDLPLRLVATMIVPADARWSTAVVRTGDDVRACRAGTLVGEALVLRVERARVRLRHGAHLHDLTLDDRPSPPPPPPPADSPSHAIRCDGARCAIDRALVQRTLANPAAVAGDARFLPLAGGGVRIDRIRPGSLFARLGLRDGDVVRGANGLEATGPEEWLAIYIRLRHATHVALSVTRRGERLTLDYVLR